MLLPLAFILLFYVGATIFMARSLALAPVGYEDEQGFHQVTASKSRAKGTEGRGSAEPPRLQGPSETAQQQVVAGPFRGLNAPRFSRAGLRV
jgi:hypothetical protein